MHVAKTSHQIPSCLHLQIVRLEAEVASLQIFCHLITTRSQGLRVVCDILNEE
jgi:hypothetical protein